MTPASRSANAAPLPSLQAGAAAAATTFEVHGDRATRAYHDFLRTAKQCWARDLYAALRREFDARSAREPLADADAIEGALAGTTTYGYFGWFERNLQRQKYSSPRGILATIERERPQLDAALDAIAAEAETRRPAG